MWHLSRVKKLLIYTILIVLVVFGLGALYLYYKNWETTTTHDFSGKVVSITLAGTKTTKATDVQSLEGTQSKCAFVHLDTKVYVHLLGCNTTSPGYTQYYDQTIKVGDKVTGRGSLEERAHGYKLYNIHDNHVIQGYPSELFLKKAQ